MKHVSSFIKFKSDDDDDDDDDVVVVYSKAGCYIIHLNYYILGTLREFVSTLT